MRNNTDFTVETDPRLSRFRSNIQYALSKDLHRGPQDLLWDLSHTGWEETPPPIMPDHFAANIGTTAVRELIDRFTPYFDNPFDARDFVMANMLQFSGVRPTDDAGFSWVRLEREYSPRYSFPFATQTLFGRGKLVGVRAVPASFQNSDQLRTPFFLDGSAKEGVRFTYDDGENAFTVTEASEQRPLQSAREIVYARPVRKRDGTESHRVIVNPLIGCRELCNFCVRQYDTVGKVELGADELFSRNRLTADEMAEYAFIKFPWLKTGGIESIGIVTGAFANFDNLHNFVDRFSSAVARLTKGTFDPAANSHQSMFVLTHLVTEREQMEAMQQLGVGNISHTLEVIDDSRRHIIIPPQTDHPNIVNKADVTFEQALRALPEANEVFGADKFRVIVIIGLDDLETTIYGTTALHNAGAGSLDTSIFRAHSVASLGDYAMGFVDLMRAKQHVIDTFRPEKIR